MGKSWRTLQKIRGVTLPKMGKVRSYQFRCSLLITLVPLICMMLLIALLYCFAQINLYFLENNGLMISEEIRQAYADQIKLEMYDVVYYLFLLVGVTFFVGYVAMTWAVSPFVNAEKTLRLALANSGKAKAELGWLSECPELARTVQKLVVRLRDPLAPFPREPDPVYSFNFRFFAKFALIFAVISVLTGNVMGIVLSTVYTKIVSLALSFVKMNHRGYYFTAQEELLSSGVKFMTYVSVLSFVIIGIQITRYLSNMTFVFVRAIHRHHFPLKLRDSDVYHGLADAISDVAQEAGLSQERP